MSTTEERVFDGVGSWVSIDVRPIMISTIVENVANDDEERLWV